MMNKIMLLAIMLYVSISSYSQNNATNWYRICIAESDSCGFVDNFGNMVVDYGKYNLIFTDTFVTNAIVFDKKEGIIIINKRLKKLYDVAIFDNGPDPMLEGVFRIIKDGRYGFSNLDKIVIRPKYNYVYPFSDSLALFIKGDVTITSDYTGEHQIVSGKKYGFINHFGKVIILPIYDYAISFKDGLTKVIYKGNKIIINKEGITVGEWH